MKTTIALTVLGALLSIGAVLDGHMCYSYLYCGAAYIPNLGPVTSVLLVLALLCLGSAAYRLGRILTPIEVLPRDIEAVAPNRPTAVFYCSDSSCHLYVDVQWG